MGNGSVLRPRVGVGSLSSPLEIGADRAQEAADNLAAALRACGCDSVNLGPVGNAAAAAEAGRRAAESHLDALALAAVSWFEDYLVLDLIEECRVPILFRPLPGMETGALCGTQQVTCYLKQLELPCATVFGELADPVARQQAMVFLRAAALKQRLRRARIGLAGHRVGGMTHTAPNEFLLKKAIGPRVVSIDLPNLLERSATQDERAATGFWQTVHDRASHCTVTEATGVDSMRVYMAIKREIERHALHALTVGCYPHLMGRVCLAASLLADEGIPLACEGDVHGAVGQLMLQLLTGQPTHNTDWLDPADDRSVVFTHCGSGSFSLAEQPGAVTLASVRLMDQGVCALFTAKPGPVTLLNITTSLRGYQCGLLEGESVPTAMVFPGNPVRVRFQQPVSSLIDWIHNAGLGHHWMIGYGHVGAEVRAWAKLCGASLDLVEPAP